jgi:succinate-acetate transporter protein
MGSACGSVLFQVLSLNVLHLCILPAHKMDFKLKVVFVVLCVVFVLLSIPHLNPTPTSRRIDNRAKPNQLLT